MVVRPLLDRRKRGRVVGLPIDGLDAEQLRAGAGKGGGGQGLRGAGGGGPEKGPGLRVLTYDTRRIRY